MTASLTGRERFLAALEGKELDRPPIWFMRQAGRYLPEYRAVRERYTFDSMVATPDIAAEVTVQPLKRFDLDAAIIFSDILVPLAAMGRPAVFGERGPEVDPPVRSMADVEGLRVPDPRETVDHLGQALRLVREAVPDKAVLGFAAAPFTLAAYLVEGRGTRNFAATKTLLYREPDTFDRLLARATDVLIAHLKYQLDEGATAVQVFDTWAEALAPHEYAEIVLPHVQRLVREVRGPERPVIYFCRGTAHLLQHLPKVRADAYSIDWRLDLRDARRGLGPEPALQGNLDPTALLAPPPRVAEETRRILAHGAEAGKHVFNLGHGILPMTPIESVQAMVDTVTSWEG